MSSTINPYSSYSSSVSTWLSQQAGSPWWAGNTGSDKSSGMLDFLSNRAEMMVSFSMQNICDRVTIDLAGETAAYLQDHPDLADDYVLVIVDGSSGREARAFRREELLERVDEDTRKKLADALEKQPLLYMGSSSGIPVTPEDDEELQGLAKSAQSFLDKNEKVINFLVNNGYRLGA